MGKGEVVPQGQTVSADGRSACVRVLPLELQAIVACVRGESPATLDLDWERIHRLALAHGVAPLLHRTCQVSSTDMPPELLEEWRQLRRLTALRGTIGLRQRDAVVTLLGQEGIPHLVLKGSALAPLWYGELSLRPFVDIDLLLPREEMGRARRALGPAPGGRGRGLSCGFRPGRRGPRTGVGRRRRPARRRAAAHVPDVTDARV